MLQAVLSGSWREERTRPDRDQLEAVVPLLLANGTHGLGWRQVPPGDTGRFRSLRDAYWRTVLDQADHEKGLQQVLMELHRVGVEPILVKGWSVARLYPEPGLRPCGDIDLCVRPDQLDVTQKLLAGITPIAGPVDLHAGIADLDHRSWDQVWQRSRLVALGEGEVRILGAEDQVRQLCLHLLRHGAFRPLWLCDVAVAVENQAAGFDWDYCLYGQGRLSDWVWCALDLAHRLLDARLDKIVRSKKAPRWMEECVRRQWSAGNMADSHSRDAIPIRQQLRRPANWLRALRCRWANPIEAAFKSGASPWTWLPLAWYQFRYAAVRALRLVAKSRAANLAAPLTFHLHQHEDRCQAA